ncbi:flagellar protein FlaG [Stappia sp.]|jgi:flagellar protein FlaG|uniref:flagellar protein FlaG n=1 Tax=Stappia sp. TaxID=1870903 RepID=UPI003A99196F
METGAVRPPVFVQPPTAKPAEPENAPAIVTEIAPEKAVMPANDAQSLRPRNENGSTSEQERPQPVEKSDIKRVEYRDKITDSLVFRAIDTQTGEVVRQIPEEALLRLRRAFAATTHQEMTGLDVNRKL